MHTYTRWTDGLKTKKKTAKAEKKNSKSNAMNFQHSVTSFFRASDSMIAMFYLELREQNTWANPWKTLFSALDNNDG